MKIFGTCFLCLAIAGTQTLYAQEAEKVENVFKVNFMLPGVSYEARIGHRQTIYAEAYLGFTFNLFYSSGYGSESEFQVAPGMETGYRYYYNGNRRSRKGLATNLNNMNYFTFLYLPSISDVPISNAYIGEENKRLINTLGAAWGFQRNYRNRISLDMYAGAGCYIASSTKINLMGDYYSVTGIAPTLLLKVRVGIWLNKRKN